MLGLPCSFAPAQSSAPGTSRIVGVVGDSLNSAPLRGAEVIASGVTTTATTDSLGRFTLDRLPPGTYQVGVFHPLLESLGITLATKPFVVGPDSEGVVTLAVPSVATLVHRYCGSAQTSADSAAVAGRVTDPDNDERVAGAKVSLAWTDLSVSKESGVVRTPHELHTETDATGFFKFCAVPSDLDGTVQAVRGYLTTPEIPLSLNGASLAFHNMSIPSGSSVTRSTGVVTGHVVSPEGKAVARARIEIPMSSVSTITREDGGFRFPEVLTGTELLVVYSLGHSSANQAVNVTSRRPTDVTITVGPTLNLLDPVLVTARRNQALEKNGFNRRERAGFGHYFTREDIDQRRPNYITDILKGVAGFNVSYVRGGAVITGRPGIRTGGCTTVYVDGIEWRDLEPGELDTFVNPDDVIGLEVYQSGEEPAQFRKFDRGCVTLVVWTQMRGKAKN
jgi:hypothetical protein